MPCWGLLTCSSSVAWLSHSAQKHQTKQSYNSANSACINKFKNYPEEKKIMYFFPTSHSVGILWTLEENHCLVFLQEPLTAQRAHLASRQLVRWFSRYRAQLEHEHQSIVSRNQVFFFFFLKGGKVRWDRKDGSAAKSTGYFSKTYMVARNYL